MADVGATLVSWSSTSNSNSPSGATTIGTGLDDNLREIQGVIVRGLSHKGSDIASVAGTTDIGAVEGLMHDITGANAITGLGTVRAGILKVLKFEGAATLTHNATSLILPGAANIVCADGDVGVFISEGSGNWRCLGFMRASGNFLGPVLSAEQASTSGTTVDFTIPAWAKKVTVLFNGVSLSGTDNLLIQLGDPTVETSGYVSTASLIANTVTDTTSTAGFVVTSGPPADSSVNYGAVTLFLQDAAGFTWVATGLTTRDGITTACAGVKSTSAAMSTVRVTTTGSDTFDAGAISVQYE